MSFKADSYLSRNNELRFINVFSLHPNSWWFEKIETTPIEKRFGGPFSTRLEAEEAYTIYLETIDDETV